MDASKIVIAGGTGFLGKLLRSHFEAQGREVVVIGRSGGVTWDGKTQGEWAKSLEGAEAVVNLSGKSIAQKWTPARLQEMEDSRVQPTLAIAEAIKSCKTPPKVWINASAVGFYGDTGSREASEATRAGSDALGKMCVRWESACLSADTPDTRKVCIRIGVVLDDQAEFVKATSRVAKMGIGSALGSGRQYISWIHSGDLMRMFEWCLYEPVQGAINACSPNPVTNAQYMEEIRGVYGRPNVPAVPAPVVRAVVSLMGKEPYLLLSGQRAVPEIALARGFRFRFPEIKGALDDVLRAVPEAWRTA